MSQSSTSMARSRSLRLPAKGTLTALQPSPLMTTPTISTGTSNLSLFLTNLRLLDLDQEPDWPEISPVTFSARDAAGGQKKRIQCVEWALYQLFLLWDHSETQNRIRPFYPPLDQVQSINLRAALTRCLEQAKKNGVLGRDAVVRKTMLDECKGERLEEVLAVFSSAVLKKLVAERALNSGPEYRPTVSENLALENWGYSGVRGELTGLLLAHKASLRSHLARKDATRDRYSDFEELLARKEQDIAQRKEQTKTVAIRDVPEISDTAKAEVRRLIRNNWTGNEQWIDGLLCNGTQTQKGGLLGTPFEEVWADVQEGRASHLEEQSAGLLQQLDHRVRLQRTRLDKWDGFRKKMFGDSRGPRTPEPKREKKQKGIDLGFNAHLNMNKDVNDIPALDAPPSEYSAIFQGLKAESAGSKTPKIPNFAALGSGSKRTHGLDLLQRLEQPQPSAEPISDLSEWEDEPEELQLPPSKPAQPLYRRGSRQQSTSTPNKPIHRQASRPKLLEEPQTEDTVASSSTEDPVTRSRQTRRTPLTRPVQDSHSRGPDHVEPITTLDGTLASTISLDHNFQHDAAREAMPPPPLPPSPTQAAADEILASMTNASPSPVKKSRYTLSLAERTRMSMSTKPSFDTEDQTPETSPVKDCFPKINGELIADPEPGEEYEDLVARTRRSMIGFEAARQKAQLERRRSQRKSKVVQRKESLFPPLDEGIEGDTSVAEELMGGGQEDYEAIFRSRPRIATSPGPSPGKIVEED
ncbi:HAUS augmin-like complex subunit 6 N-terminus-domain-containing protein [Xylariaceae sp. FL0016]|nr:HAUS augmin-like complex subunit 6 N-terminus-domain-containing protein [Xylariaceae sp. FL0016]